MAKTNDVGVVARTQLEALCDLFRVVRALFLSHHALLIDDSVFSERMGHMRMPFHLNKQLI